MECQTYQNALKQQNSK